MSTPGSPRPPAPPGPRVLRSALLLALLLGVACAASPLPKPNIVLFVIDTLRADHVGAYGYVRDTTPHLDRLAAEGVRFETAIAHSSWSAPSHTSIVTGTAPTTHGVRRWGDRLSDATPPLAVRLRRAGYATGLFSSHYSLHRGVRGIRAGIDHADVRRNEHDRQVLDAAVAWASRQSRPYFLYIVTMTPHAPYDRYPSHYDETLFTELPEGGDVAFPFAGSEWTAQGAIPGSVQLHGEHRVGAYVNRYDRAVRHGDDLLGSFVERLASQGSLDDTVVLVTSDHGEGLGERGIFAHEVFLYDFLVRVPWIVRYPARIAPGRVVTEPVQLADVVPTLLGLAGMDPIDGLDGLDLTPHLVDGSEPPARMAHALYAHRGLKRFMARSAAYKLIHDPVGRVSEFFDLTADPGEERSLARSDLSGDALAAYDRHRRALTGLAARYVERSAPAALSPDVRAELRALGYLDE